MAVLEFEKGPLNNMVGRKLTNEDYMTRIPYFGCPLEKMEEDIIHYEVSPNRPDLLSIEGFGRAIGNFISSSPKITKYNAKKGRIILKVDPTVKKVRPNITCAVVRKVKITDDLIKSLMQVQEKLHDTLGRKRKKVAIGVHDMKKVEPPFTYKGVTPNEIKFVPLDFAVEMTPGQVLKEHPKGVEYAHIVEKYSHYPIIVDKHNHVLSLPPIINGELTRVTDNTTDLFIDVTGTDDIAINQALNILVTSFADRGFEVETVTIVEGRKKIQTPNLNRWKIKVNVGYVNKILGFDLSKTQIKNLLKKMDIEFDGRYATIPPYRADIMHQMDIVEDVAIAYGYENFKPGVPNVATVGRPLEKNDNYYLIKEMVVGLGFQEVITLTLSNHKDEFDKMNIEHQPIAETLNSVTPECNIFRRELLPSLMDVLANNRHYEYPQRIFELGDTVLLDEKSETGARNVKRLALATADTRISYEQLSSKLDALMRNIGVKYNLAKKDHPSYIKGRSASIKSDDKEIGMIGEIAPEVLANWGIEMPVVAFEITLDML